MAITIAVIIAMIVVLSFFFFSPSMFSPWPRWRETDGGDGHQP